MDYLISQYISATEFLPSRLRSAAQGLDRSKQSATEEFRLREGRHPTVLLPDGEHKFDDRAVTREEVAETVARAARGSIHSVSDELAAGFVTAPGGHRLGVCGRAAVDCGACRLIRDFTSVNLRIAKEVCGAADDVVDEVCGDYVCSTLILSPPGAGKTTLLRDLVRQVSDRGYRVSIADERGEIAAFGSGGAGFDVGEHTDVLTGAPKAYSVLTLLRSMDPQVIALDEVTDPADFDAISHVIGCGTAVFATMHAEGVEAAARRPHGCELLEMFERAVVIERVGGVRRAHVVDLSGRPWQS